jgi:hypothetical protein
MLTAEALPVVMRFTPRTRRASVPSETSLVIVAGEVDAMAGEAGETELDPGSLRLLTREVHRLAEKALGAECRFQSVLDFGCGCARLTRYFPTLLVPGGTLKGCDIDAEATTWNQQNLQKSGGFFTSPDHPPHPCRLPSVHPAILICEQMFAY